MRDSDLTTKDSAPLTLTEDNFETVVLQSDQLMIVDFWADWCRPCHALMPTIEQLANRPDIGVGKLNVDQNTVVAARYGVQSIPTVLFFKNGEVVETLVGVHPIEVYEEALLKHSDAACDAGG
ncbi:MAG: thioredoxin [Planctomycetota bacterium]